MKVESGKAIDEIKRTMGPLEKLAALKVWWWAQREGETVIARILGNKWTTVIGGLVVFLGAIDAANVLPEQWDNMLGELMAVIAGSGLIFAKDATTGSPPGATK